MFAESYSDAPVADSENDVRSLQQRAAQVQRVLLRLLGSLLRLERVARVQRVVAEREVHAAAQRPEAGLRHDVDEHHAGRCGSRPRTCRCEKRIDRICDFGGSLPPRKPSTRIVAPGPAISFSTCSISSGIVGQRVDLILRQHVAEPIAVRIGRDRRRVAADRDALVELLDRQRHLAPVVAGAHADVGHDRRLEARESSTSTAYRPGVRSAGGRDTLAVGRQRRLVRTAAVGSSAPLT